MSQNIIQKTLFHNLKLLDFQSFLNSFDKKIDRLQFNEKMFEKANEKAFQMVTYFLFTTLDKENKKRFNGCFPCYDRKQEADFRKSTTECFRELEKTRECQIKLLPVLLHNPYGDTFCNLYISLSNHVLTKLMKRRFHYMENLSEFEDLESEINKRFQEYERNELELIKSKKFWEENSKYFAERHKKLSEEFDKSKQSSNETNGVLSSETILNELKTLESQWQSLNTITSKITVDCLQQVQLVDDVNEVIFDATKLINKGNQSTDKYIDFCEMFSSSIKPIENFFEHINSLSHEKLQDVLSHVSLAKVQLAKHNIHVEELKSKLKQTNETLQESNLKLRLDLLESEPVKRRKEWFRKQLPTNFPQLLFEPKRMDTVAPQIQHSKRRTEKPKYRMSDVNYSFQFGDISTLNYVPPPILEESCILSPVREGVKKIDSYDSFDLEKEEQHFYACD